MNFMPTIDLALLTRDDRPLQDSVRHAIESQVDVRLNVHRVIGQPGRTDASRIATIVRARNEAVRRGRSDHLMFLDDDVVLGKDCIARLHHALVARSNYGAFAADYLGESSAHRDSRHVAMGATLFRRSVLERHAFRWEPSKCECLCRCEDIRRSGARIGYLSGAKAWHLTRQRSSADCARRNAAAVDPPPISVNPEVVKNAKILVAFNRRDVRRFQDVFLRTLRASGNTQEVIVVGYGLYPSEIQSLQALPNVRFIRQPYNGQLPPVRRLTDFRDIVAQLPKGTPVAYWDAGDVLFQGRLDSLWQQTQQHPSKILAVSEPLGFPHNKAIRGWTQTIEDSSTRQRAFELFASNPFLNSGFSAGTAESLSRYFTEAVRLRSRDLRGTTDWGDQTALNLYCHSDSERWVEVSEDWNFCVHDRRRGDVRVLPNGQVLNRQGTAMPVVHGNARSLTQLAIVR
ncbi:glycosyltransferase family 2 protein [Rhodopirellula sp. P2]|uniref:glycosyltransferase family 2 protein n=1 Tax=Rhodopirellula sp. P2 TaxID=2127060 RepID=UPI003FD0B6BB